MKTEIHLFCVCVFLLLSAPVARAQAQITDGEVQTALRARLEGAKSGIGIVVGLIDQSGSRVIAYGKPGRKTEQMLDGDSVFEIGSISKVFTTVLLADLVEHGEVSLDDPISKYLPQSVRTPVRNGREITLLHLATHTSGLPWMPRNWKPSWKIVGPARSIVCPICVDYSTLYRAYSLPQMYDSLAKYKLPRDLEAEYEYSNYGMGLLGQILSLRIGMDYETLVRTRITQPLGMDSTGIKLTSEMQRRAAVGHNEAGKPVADLWMPVFDGAGGLRSTAKDLLKFVAANLELRPTPLATAMQKSHQPQYSTGAANFQVGMGWHIFRQFDGEVTMHGGVTFGHRTFIAFDRKRQRGVVVLSNFRNDSDENSIADIALYLLDKTQYPLSEAPEKRREITVDPGILDNYVGEYQSLEAQHATKISTGLSLKPSIILKVSREGSRLFVEPAGQKKSPIFAETQSDFFWDSRDARKSLNVGDARATFVKDNTGRVTHLILHWDGYHQSARRIN